MKHLIFVALLLSVLVCFQFVIIYKVITETTEVSEELLNKAWAEGYNKYISDYHIPAPGLPEQKESIPVKRPDPDLKEKFKG